MRAARRRQTAIGGCGGGSGGGGACLTNIKGHTAGKIHPHPAPLASQMAHCQLEPLLTHLPTNIQTVHAEPLDFRIHSLIPRALCLNHVLHFKTQTCVKRDMYTWMMCRRKFKSKGNLEIYIKNEWAQWLHFFLGGMNIYN